MPGAGHTPLSRLSPQMSHLFNVAHTLRMLVQKERSLDILKVSRARGSRRPPPARPWGLCAGNERPGLPGVTAGPPPCRAR